MARKEKRELTQGSSMSFYLDKQVPQAVIDWLNSQSDRTLLLSVALDLAYQQYGKHGDLNNVIPRSYAPFQNVPIQTLESSVAPVPVTYSQPSSESLSPSVQAPSVPVEGEQKRVIVEKELSTNETAAAAESPTMPKEQHEKDQKQGTTEEKQTSSWSNLDLEGDLYA